MQVKNNENIEINHGQGAVDENTLSQLKFSKHFFVVFMTH